MLIDDDFKSDQALLENPFKLRESIFDSFFDRENSIEAMTRADFETYLPGDILTKVDRASMAVSLEVRSPWLSKEIINFCYRKIPPSLKVVPGGATRLLQKALAARFLPRDIDINRKQGFSLPTERKTSNLTKGSDLLDPALLEKAGLDGIGVQKWLDQSGDTKETFT